jgi:hypothetical protein
LAKAAKPRPFLRSGAFKYVYLGMFGCGGRLCPVRVLKQSTGLFYRAGPDRPLTLQVMVSSANEELPSPGKAKLFRQR